MSPASARSESLKSTTRGRPAGAKRPAGAPLKSATRPRATYGTGPVREDREPATPRPVASPADARAAQIEFFIDHLSSVPNKRGKPYSPLTISPYRDAILSLSRYLTRTEFSGGFEEVDVPTLNGYLSDYRTNNSQGGTVTKQSNLRVFFAWLVEEYGAEEVYTHPKRHRYAREDEPPPILADDFLDDLLKITLGMSFEAVRDHAIIRVLLTGVRRAELTALYVEDLDLWITS